MRNNRAMAPSRHRVAVLALDHVVGLDLGTPSQILGAARDHDGNRFYKVRTCTPGGAPVRSTAGFTVLPDHGLDLLEAADTVIVPGIHDGPPLHSGVLTSEVADALTTAHARGARIVSICTGSFVLAATGLLDGRPAATHWAHADRFVGLFPQVKLDADVLFVDDGEILTSAGVAAGIDLCLHLIRRDHGTEVANRAARRCVVPPWRDGGQAQYTERPVPPPTSTGTAATREWALRRLGEPLTLERLAAHARMSVRTFTRHFRDETGLSPAQWLLRHRTDRARELLESSDLSVARIARETGFGSAAALRQRFQQALGVSPLTYRRTFAPR
ncbi:GlxA family transcriptional regulator [Virgisporangium ochraceum]|uniref:AraC family transcriptional regulator n=1 Tax=Virgisporangium ochraceum TaxID=65505 RepID=A0A8J3ZTM7_9ACTN|nr:helix-turn-helix domain-containing protein [Virgisporangium ochraceum]GIJ67281.1 AraC family transcriptional regulator [Virgisporangium ochraceum]